MKLIRDRIPNLDRGQTRHVRDAAEYDILLRLKLCEEAAEAAAATSDEELALELGDLYEVMRTLANHRGIVWDEVMRLREEKAKRKGGFLDGVVLTYDTLDNKGGTR